MQVGTCNFVHRKEEQNIILMHQDFDSMIGSGRFLASDVIVWLRKEEIMQRGGFKLWFAFIG
jgi:hypothetical protein